MIQSIYRLASFTATAHAIIFMIQPMPDASAECAVEQIMARSDGFGANSHHHDESFHESSKNKKASCIPAPTAEWRGYNNTKHLLSIAEMIQILLAVATLACRHDIAVDALALLPITPPRSRSISLRRQVQIANASRKAHLLSATRSTPNSSLSTQEEARQLIEENTLPCDEDDEDCNPLSPYDAETVAPIESEFYSLMATFLTYSPTDIQSMTSTSHRYLNYKSKRHQPLHKETGKHGRTKQPRQRSKEEGIRYRTLYSGVQAASMEPAVLRSFTVLFEDYLPIRLAGRRIYNHLNNVMEEVRLERIGEIERARELCSGWDWINNDETHQHFIEYARCIWDTLMDEALLLEGEETQIGESGVIPLQCLLHLGFDQVLMQNQLVTDRAKLEFITKQIIHEEGSNGEAESDQLELLERHDSISFVEFMRVLYHFTLTSSESQSRNDMESLIQLLQTIKETAMSRRKHKTQDTSTLLAAAAIRSGGSNACKKRRKHSDQFDHYVATFSVWESKFLNGDDARLAKQPPRRLEILRGCFEGAKNESIVAALKIVYMGKRDNIDMISRHVRVSKLISESLLLTSCSCDRLCCSSTGWRSDIQVNVKVSSMTLRLDGLE